MKRLLLRLVLSVVAAAMAAIVAALAITIADLYLVGHGHAGLGKEITGIHLSASDLILISAVLLAAAGAWTISRPKR